MREVKKQNIINKIAVGVFMLIGTSTFAQYSPTLMSDSIKQEILTKYKHTLQPNQVQDMSVNRKNMAIFCKWELDIEDKSKIPIKFRLGSQAVVDRLEQKGPTTTKID